MRLWAYFSCCLCFDVKNRKIIREMEMKWEEMEDGERVGRWGGIWKMGREMEDGERDGR
jgi:hypothetical protein